MDKSKLESIRSAYLAAAVKQSQTKRKGISKYEAAKSVRDLIAAAQEKNLKLSPDEVLEITAAGGRGYRLSSPTWIASKQAELATLQSGKGNAAKVAALRKTLAIANEPPKLPGLVNIKKNLDDDDRALYPMYNTQLWVVSSFEAELKENFLLGIDDDSLAFRKSLNRFEYLLTVDDLSLILDEIPGKMELLNKKLPDGGQRVFEMTKQKKVDLPTRKGVVEVNLPSLLLPNKQIYLEKEEMFTEQDDLKKLILYFGILAHCERVYGFERKDLKGNILEKMKKLANDSLGCDPKVTAQTQQEVMIVIFSKCFSKFGKLSKYYQVKGEPADKPKKEVKPKPSIVDAVTVVITPKGKLSDQVWTEMIVKSNSDKLDFGYLSEFIFKNFAMNPPLERSKFVMTKGGMIRYNPKFLGAKRVEFVGELEFSDVKVHFILKNLCSLILVRPKQLTTASNSLGIKPMPGDASLLYLKEKAIFKVSPLIYPVGIEGVFVLSTAKFEEEIFKDFPPSKPAAPVAV